MCKQSLVILQEYTCPELFYLFISGCDLHVVFYCASKNKILISFVYIIMKKGIRNVVIKAISGLVWVMKNFMFCNKSFRCISLLWNWLKLTKARYISLNRSIKIWNLEPKRLKEILYKKTTTEIKTRKKYNHIGLHDDKKKKSICKIHAPISHYFNNKMASCTYSSKYIVWGGHFKHENAWIKWKVKR